MSHVWGDTDGLKKKEIQALEKLLRRSVAPDSLMSPALAEEVCQLSLEIHHPVTLLLDRQGRVVMVFVGTIAQLGERNGLTRPARQGELLGVRAASTQLEDRSPPDKPDLTTVLQYSLDALVTLVATHHPQWSAQFGEHPKACDAVFLSGLCINPQKKPDVNTDGPMTLYQLEKLSFKDHVEWVESDLGRHKRQGVSTSDARETAFLVSIAQTGQHGRFQAEDQMDELSLLVKTAGAQVVGRMIQAKTMPDPTFYLGRGKAQELAFEIQQLGVNLVVVNDELSSVQQRALETVLRCRVVDRTEVILDIFAQRAQSWEGKIQVELAQLQYLLPRLTGRGTAFSQQTAGAKGGGIATRGPGETKLELDRRRMRARISDLEKQAESVKSHRLLHRRERLDSQIPVIALVGYTNAGKSTLLNHLTHAETLAENKLFATLDPLTRKLVRPGLPPVLLIDTVGFIQKLPTTLVKAFRSTLEEIQSATLIFHVVDLSHPDRLTHIRSVQSTLVDLECDSKPQWVLLNKIDRVKHPEAEVHALLQVLDGYPVFPISAKTGDGVATVLEALQQFLENPDLVVGHHSVSSLSLGES